MTRVIKIGGRAQSDPALPRVIAEAVRRDVSLCIVHGGGDEVSALQRRLGLEPRFVGGRRVTTAEDIDIVRMVLSGVTNKRLVGQLANAGVPAVGISGEDGDLIVARSFADGALGYVGEPARVNVAVLQALLLAGFMPVISPVGRDIDGAALNINGDDAAAAIAASLGADELLLIADVPGVRESNGSVIADLTEGSIADLIDRGVAVGGMIAKLEAAQRALSLGVARVRIGDLSAVVDARSGTSLHRETSLHFTSGV